MIAALAIAGATVTACGKKGPPLTPIVRVPAAAGVAEVRRIGSDAYVVVTVPEQNIDASSPASVSRVELYGATSLTPPNRARFLEIATLVATVPVAPAADPEDPALPVPPPPPDAALQGTTVILRDALDAEELTPRELPMLEDERRRQEETERRAVAAGAVLPPRVLALRRFYLAIAYSERGRSGPLSQIVELPLIPPPDPPAGVAFAERDNTLLMQWEPSGGLVGFLMGRSLPLEPAPFPESGVARAAAPPTSMTELPPGPTLYNVYREIAPDPLLLPDAAPTRTWLAAAPKPVNAAPLSALSFSEPLEIDQRQRCYAVRAVRGSFESDPSQRFCVTPSDTLAPAVPTGLAAIVGEGAINLIWEPNAEPDLGGYVVLRRGAADDTLLQLTPTPVSDTRFTDRGATPGVRYTYEVRAVDMRIPLANVSEAAVVTETAR